MSIHDLKPGQDVSIETLTILRKQQHEQAVRESSNAVQADPPGEPAASAKSAEVRKAKQPGVRGVPAASALAQG